MVKKEKARKFTFDIGWVFASSIISMGVGILLKTLVGNNFDADGLGAYSMVITIWTIVYLTAGIGVYDAVVKYIAEFRDKDHIKNSIISVAMVNAFVLGFIATIVLFIASPTIESIFNIPNLSHHLRIVSLSFPFLLMNNIFVGLFNGLRLMKHYALFEITRRSVLLFTTILFVWLGYGLSGAIIAMVISPIAITIMVLFYQRKMFTFRLKYYVKYTKKLIKFGSQLYFANAATMINSEAAILLIGFYLTDQHVGIYAVLLMFFNLMVVLPRAMQRVALPTLSTYFREKKKKLVSKLMESFIKFSFVFLSIISLILIVFIGDIIALIFPGKETFLLAITPLRILVIIGLLWSTIVPVIIVYVAAGRPEIPLKISLVKTGTNVTLALFLVPISFTIIGLDIGGINGAVIALGVSLILELILFFIFLNPCLRLKINVKFILTGFLFFICVTSSIFMFSSHFEINQNLIGTLMIIIYGLGLYFGILTKKDRERFMKEFQKK